jgi:Spy/CpxP family protein refolding chaperone
MKTPSRLILLCAMTVGVLLCLHEGPLAAQTSPAAQGAADLPTPEQVVSKMSDKLSLSADQKTKITPIIADRQAKLKALSANTSLSRPQRMRQARSILNDSDSKINAILTPEQQQKYSQMQQEMREQMKERAQQHGAGTG